jgi:hypothetical protein
MTVLGLLVGSWGAAMAQEQNPGPPRGPTAFETRNTGGTDEEEASIQKEEGKVTKVTFTAVTASRDWKDPQGKVIRGRLLAFEAAGGEVADLVRNGKVRLLVDGAKRFSLLPLEKLSTEDRTYITGLAAARKQQAGEPKAADPAKP